jgi:hypothetical protein
LHPLDGHEILLLTPVDLQEELPSANPLDTFSQWDSIPASPHSNTSTEFLPPEALVERIDQLAVAE